jgi:hypothetical protein
MSRSGGEHTMTGHHQNRRLRHLAIRAMLVTFLGCSLARPAAAARWPPAIRSVRSTDRAIAALIDRAAAQSLTFSRLLTLIEATNGVVYVEPGDCRHGVRACLKMWMEVSGPNRFLRVVVDGHSARSDVEVMASIGHELQHAIEALSEQALTNGVQLYSFFGRLAPTDNNRFETTAAINAGDAVRDELRGR